MADPDACSDNVSLKCDEECERVLKGIWNYDSDTRSDYYKNRSFFFQIFDKYWYSHCMINDNRKIKWCKSFDDILRMHLSDRRAIDVEKKDLKDRVLPSYNDEYRCRLINGTINYENSYINTQLIYIAIMREEIAKCVARINIYDNLIQWFSNDEPIPVQYEKLPCEQKPSYDNNTRWFCTNNELYRPFRWLNYGKEQQKHGEFDYHQIGKYRIGSPDFDFWLRRYNGESLTKKLQLTDRQIDYSPRFDNDLQKRIYYAFETYYARTLLRNWWIATGCKLHGIENIIEHGRIFSMENAFKNAAKNTEMIDKKLRENKELRPFDNHYEEIAYDKNMMEKHMNSGYATLMLKSYESYKECIKKADRYIIEKGFDKSQTPSAILLKREIENSGVFQRIEYTDPPSAKSGFCSWLW